MTQFLLGATREEQRGNAGKQRIDLGAGVGAQLRDLRRLRADPLLSGVPALLLSTRSEEELRQRGITLGPMDYVLRTG